MSISPPGDIVFDVLRAAEPTRQRTAAQQLSRAAVSAEPATFQSPPAVPPGLTFDPTTAMIDRHNRAVLARPQGQSSGNVPLGPLRQFEQMVLQDFVQRMLPENSTANFGEGTAGSIWKSWMAEAVSREIVQAGGVGIADTLARNHDQSTVKPVVQPTGAQLRPEPVSQSNPSDHDMTTQVAPASSSQNVWARLQEVFFEIFGGESRVTALADDPFRMGVERDV